MCPPRGEPNRPTGPAAPRARAPGSGHLLGVASVQGQSPPQPRGAARQVRRQRSSAGALAPSGGHRPEQQRPALPLPPAVGPWPALAWGPWGPWPPPPRLLTPLPGSALRGRMGAGGRGGATLARSARTLTPQDTIPLRDLRHPASWESGGPAAGPSAALGPGMRAREQGPPRGLSLLPG